MQLRSRTDIGLVRRENQDACGHTAVMDGWTLAVVCDGMGGAQGGALASQMAVEHFLKTAQELLQPSMTPEQLREALLFCVARINTLLYETAQKRADCHGMGTTLVAALTDGTELLVCNVGDSRAYRLGAEGLRRISKDHSLVEHLIDCGDITAEEARRHPNRHYITRALGPEMNAAGDCFVETLAHGDKVLLCTDGLVMTVTDAQMETILRENAPEESLEKLFALAYENGAPDNVTAVLLYQD